jgi:hypothetical protein
MALARLFVPMRPPVAVLATGYVVTVGLLGGLAFAHNNGPSTVELVAFLLLLPTLPISLPVIYVVGALAWNIRASMPGEPMWPVTVTFTLLFIAAAIANVLVLWAAVSWRRRRTPAPA